MTKRDNAMVRSSVGCSTEVKGAKQSSLTHDGQLEMRLTLGDRRDERTKETHSATAYRMPTIEKRNQFDNVPSCCQYDGMGSHGIS